MKMKRNLPVEVLAPAGNLFILKAVVDAGADAVYLGGERFGARAYADNFSSEDIAAGVRYAHLRNARVYLTVNTLLKNKEIENELFPYLKEMQSLGIDAVIVQDFGVLSMVRDCFPDLHIHASTQMSTAGALSAAFLRSCGAVRVVTARELSLAEISALHREVPDVEIETFVHGALCVSYSGQCLFSSMLGGRSGNRGRCAQPCRLPYRVVDRDVATDNGGANGGAALSEKSKNFPLSPKDLCGIRDLPALLDAGVYSLKIEGRMKQKEYAAGVTAVYREMVDFVLAQRDGNGELRYAENSRSGSGQCSEQYSAEFENEFDKAEQKLLALGNRDGFTNAYYYRHNDEAMMVTESSAHRKDKAGASVTGAAQTEADGRRRGADDRANREKRNAEPIGNAEPAKSRIPITGVFRAEAGQPMRFSVLLSDEVATVGVSESVTKSAVATVSGAIPAPAKNAPVSEADIEKHLRKTGESQFFFSDILIELHGDLFIPVKEIKELRRNALSMLENEVLAANGWDAASLANRRDIEPKPVSMNNPKKMQAKTGERNRQNTTVLTIRTISQFDAICDIVSEDCNSANVAYKSANTVCKASDTTGDTIDADRNNLDAPHSTEIASKDAPNALITIAIPADKLQNQALITRIKTQKQNSHSAPTLRLIFPPIMRQDDTKKLSALFEDNIQNIIDEYAAQSYDALQFLEEKGIEKDRIILTERLYTYSNRALQAFRERGYTRFTVPVELNEKELRHRDNADSELILYGRANLMVTANCIRKNTKGCDKTPSTLYLTDRKNIRFPVENVCAFCYNEIRNSVPTNLFLEMKSIEALAPRAFRLDFTDETEAETKAVLRAYETAVRGAKNGGGASSSGLSNGRSGSGGANSGTVRTVPNVPYTKGHFRRGVE